MSESATSKETVLVANDSARTSVFPTHKNLLSLSAIVIILIITSFELRRQGRLWWCVCGEPYLWAGDVQSLHNSQHLFDPYSFTHILHGIILCGVLAYFIPRLSANWRLVIAIGIESLWEVFENSTYIIQRYRAETISLGYQGDTIANSLGDIFCCGVGFLLARQIGFRRSLVLFAVFEIMLLVWIRDSLLLNVLMLIYPIEAIKSWQMGH